MKRGWTDKESTSKNSRRRREPSKGAEAVDDGLEGKKLRFKTTLPPNATAIDEKTKERAKKRKSKDGKRSKDKTVVEEFSTSSAPQAADNHGVGVDSSTLSYEEGRGWIDQNGEVAEAEPNSASRRSKVTRRESERRVSAIESKETEALPAPIPLTELKDTIEDDNMSIDAAAADSAVETEATTKEVHPLEALFKRPADKPTTSAKPRPHPIDTSFSFFDAPTAEDADMEADLPPQTPHTKRDLEWRNIRSAAPTPDTAAIGRKFSFPFAHGSEEDQSEEDAGSGDDNDTVKVDVEMTDTDHAKQSQASSAAPEHGEESAFRKWFYENRGDLNRGWKKRRREEKKAERQRENRRLSRKVA